MVDAGSLTSALDGRDRDASVLVAYRRCEDITRRSGSSFTAAFWMLPRPKRRALNAIYAFCRFADDIADDPGLCGDRALLLERWQRELEAAYRGEPEHAVGIALGDAVRRFHLPEGVFLELLRGVKSDLDATPFERFEDLRRYCHQVASTVGLLLVRVLGYRNRQTLAYAEAMGIAVQLTNVLRDVGADARSGRVYLPQDELDHYGVSMQSLVECKMTDELRLLLACHAERARLYYERAERLLPDEDRGALRPAEAMGRIYRTLLDELQRRRFPCLGEQLRLSRSRRLAIAASVWLGGMRP
jgi:phytoene synthase